MRTMNRTAATTRSVDGRTQPGTGAIAGVVNTKTLWKVLRGSRAHWSAHRKSRRGSAAATFLFLEGSSKNKTAALADGRFSNAAHRDEDHSFLAGLAATYSSKS
jgi:hypothetical protein